ncbi:uncharacterized protein A4U43_C05F3440 [Asparagus officinalis]|uniref:Uncharacterized protein n=1 Tax=Asparagus officinalis TaxID=4686 RepID=A0A5P1EP13_ASPOF|nr:uncharacterized protein A4U43_C05F3440 [Asparagus officinalis]
MFLLFYRHHAWLNNSSCLGHQPLAAHRKERSWRPKRAELHLESDEASRRREKMEEIEQMRGYEHQRPYSDMKWALMRCWMVNLLAESCEF